MSYSVESVDGNFLIQPREVDTSSTSLTLPGKDSFDWGEPYSNNFTKLLQNFAGPTIPSNGRTGQLWYNTADGGALQICRSPANAGNDAVWEIFSVGKLATAREIKLTGSALGSVTFDGSANVEMAVTLNDTGVVPGRYIAAEILVTADGRIQDIANGVTAGAGGNVNTEVNSIYLGPPPANATPSNPAVKGPLTGNAIILKNDILTLIGASAALGSTVDAVYALNSSLNTYAPLSALSNYPTTSVVAATYVAKAGDTMTGQLLLPAPGSSTAAARKQDVDAKTTRTFAGVTSSSYNVTVSPDLPSGGNNGDVWYRY